jgi:small subunit ribosomal protein S3
VGQKVHPIGFRTGVTRDWLSRWYADKQHYGQFLCEDFNIRKYVATNKNWATAGISKTEIERDQNEIEVVIYAQRPGMIIGRQGIGVDKIRGDLQKIARGKNIQIKIREVQQPEVDAQLVAMGIAEQIVKRVNYRRAMKKAVETAVSTGAFGIKVRVAGRLGGAEIARADGYTVGNLPLQKLRAIIDYGFAEAATTMGNIGVKVWIYKGDVDATTPGSK